MKVEPIYLEGSDSCAEDSHFIGEALFGVFDGFTGVHYPGHPKVVIDGETTGQIASRISREEFERLAQDEPLGRAFERINDRLAGFNILHHLVTPADWGGTTFATCQLVESKIVVSNIGDALAIVESGQFGVYVSPNQLALFEPIVLAARKKVMLQYAHIEDEDERRSVMWKICGPDLADKRNMYANSIHDLLGYGVLNGDPRALDFISYQKFDRASTETILLLTDGLAIPDHFSDDLEMAGQMLEWFHEGGLERIKEQVRSIQISQSGTSHVRVAEGTGIAITF